MAVVVIAIVLVVLVLWLLGFFTGRRADEQSRVDDGQGDARMVGPEDSI